MNGAQPPEFPAGSDPEDELRILASEDDDGGAPRLRKAPTAFRTISEVADELHVPQHVLRFWETRFSEVRPLKRGGGRRYYRPDDVDLLRRISDLLYVQGYTIKGVQRVLREGDSGDTLFAGENADVAASQDRGRDDQAALIFEQDGQLLPDPTPEPEVAPPAEEAPDLPEEIAAVDDGEVSGEDPYVDFGVEEDVSIGTPDPAIEVAAHSYALQRLAEENAALREGLRMVLEELQVLRGHIPV